MDPDRFVLVPFLSPSDAAVLPSLCSELAYLHGLQDLLQKRLDVEREYSSSLSAWQKAASQSASRPTRGLNDVFCSLIEGTNQAVESRRAMERAFQSQLEEISGKIEELQGFLNQINVRSEKLTEYDDLATNALEEREMRYKTWKAWNPNAVPLPRGFRLGTRRIPPTTAESMLVAVYDHTDLAVRRCISKAEVARYSFKQKVIEDVEAIFRSHQHAIESMGKCLRVFAENQTECAFIVNASATKLVNMVGGISASRIAGILHEALTSEAQDISITSMQYVEPESEYSISQPYPIVYGFSLPPRYFSRTPSTDIVVKIFCQMVSCVCDHQAWDEYVTGLTLSDNMHARQLCELEKSWTKDEASDQKLVSSLGPSTCANLIKTLLVSFPEPLIEWSASLAETLRGISSTTRINEQDQPISPLESPSSPVSDTARSHTGPHVVVSLVPLLEPVYKRPQGEMLQALCDSLVPFFRIGPRDFHGRVSEIFSELLTRRGTCIKEVFPTLVTEFHSIIKTIESKNTPQNNQSQED